MIPKREQVLLPEYLAFVRTLPCPCGSPAPSQAHHFPPKGRRRDIDDTKTLPVCAECHQRCHGITVVKAGKRLLPISAEEQQAEVHATWRQFVLQTLLRSGPPLR